MYFYRIAVAPTYQGKNIGKFICNWVQNYAKKNNKHVFLDCWSGNSKLKTFYDRSEFKYVDDFPEEDYFVSVFELEIERLLLQS